MAEPTYFPTPAAFRRWLEKHHQSAAELLVGFYKTTSGKPSITWPQSVDEALCFGWIDGVRRRIDDERYSIRFTPRKATSIWSAVNVKRMGDLMAEGRVAPAGLTAFERRSDRKTGIYSYEQRHEAAVFDKPFEKRFRAEKAAWKYFASEAPWYRRLTTYWVMTAKKPETREKRLGELIAASAAGQRIKQVPAQPAKKKPRPPALS